MPFLDRGSTLLRAGLGFWLCLGDCLLLPICHVAEDLSPLRCEAFVVTSLLPGSLHNLFLTSVAPRLDLEKIKRLVMIMRERRS